MGLGFPRVLTNEIDASYYVDTLLKGISCVMGVTEKGPIGKPVLIGSAEQYARIFGSDLAAYDFPLIAKRALSYGAALWISRVTHLTDGATTATTASAKLKDRATPTAVDTLTVSASSPGTWGNGLKVKVESSANDTSIFTLQVYDGDTLVETWTGLSMDETSENYVEKIKSAYITIADEESASVSPTNRPADTATPTALTGGGDGLTGLVDADYIGESSAHTGMYAFDEIDDALQLAIPGVTSPAVITAGLAYCESRGDLVYITETPFDLEPQEADDFRMGAGDYSHATYNSNYGAMYYGKLKIYDVTQQKERYISPIGDVLGVLAQNDYKASEAAVPAGGRRGRIMNALGVDVNVGKRGRLAEANLICEDQLNPIVVFDDFGAVVWGAQTLQRAASLLRELNVRRMMIVVRKAIATYARVYVHQPNLPREWRAFYRGIDPKFREWKQNEWFYDYKIVCDQDANTIDDAKLNTTESIQRGEFKVKIFVKPVVGIKWVLIDSVVTRLDADYSESVVEV